MRNARAKPPAAQVPHQHRRSSSRRTSPARMRDGVVLRADVYRPDTPGACPALLQRTPYSKNDRGADAAGSAAIAARGYVVVVQDTRGRYTSDGVARPARRGRRRLRLGPVGGDAARRQRPGRDVRRQLPRHHAARGRDRSGRRPRGAVPGLVLQPPPRHGVPGRRVLPERRASWNLGQAMDVRRRVLTPAVDRDGPIGLDAAERAARARRGSGTLPLKSFDELDLRRFAPGYFADARAPDARRFWAAGRHRGAATTQFDVPGVSPHRLVRHAADRHAAQLHRPARARRHRRARVGYQRLRRRAVDARAPDARARRRSATWTSDPTRASTPTTRCCDWFDYWLKDAPTGRAVETAPVRLFVMGANTLARRAGVAARARGRDAVLPAQRRQARTRSTATAG